MKSLTRKPLSFDESQMRKGEEKIGFMPGWKCYCCHDNGTINYHLVKLVIPDYVDGIDAWPVCKNCQEGSKYASLNQTNFDHRFDPELCKELAEIERQNWLKTARKKSPTDDKEIREKLNKLAEKFSFPTNLDEKNLVYSGKLDEKNLTYSQELGEKELVSTH